MTVFCLLLQGLTSRIFGNVPTLQVLECSGLALDSTEDLLSMTIFTSRRGNDVTLVSVNLRKGECSIAENTFSLCKLNNANSRMTSLQTLIPNPPEREPREYSCNATGYEAPGRVHTKTWSLTVSRISELILFLPQFLNDVMCFVVFIGYLSSFD